MNFSYNPLLVLLSLLVAIQASYVGLNLARRIPQAFAIQRRILIAGAALSLSVGIWAMHFVGMLAARSAIAIDYAVLPTLVSFLVCVLVTGVAISLASLRPRRMFVIAAAVMGLGIAAMHYVGMLALHSSVHMEHDGRYVVASIVIAIAASTLALWLAFAAERRPPLLVCAAVLGCAISGMHYAAMAGVTLHPMASMPASAAPAISSDLLAVIVSVVAFAVSGVFMLTLVPNAYGPAAEASPDIAALTHAPAGGPERRAAPSEGEFGDAAAPESASADDGTSGGGERFLPVEKNGANLAIGFDEIVSVHANAHYTYIFNGSDDLFCPLPISEIAARLPQAAFFRVHRSYIVGLRHVMRVRKAGDNGIAELNSAVRRSVPVSRTRVQQLRAELSGRDDSVAHARSAAPSAAGPAAVASGANAPAR